VDKKPDAIGRPADAGSPPFLEKLSLSVPILSRKRDRKQELPPFDEMNADRHGSA